MVRLRFGYVVKCTGCEKDASGNVTAVHCEYLPDTRSGTPGADAVKVKGNIHWVSAAHACEAEVRLYDRLFKVPFPGSKRGREAAPGSHPGHVPHAHATLDEHGKVVVPDLEEEYDWLDDINPDAKKTITAFLEPGLKDAKPEHRFQFERHGYFVADLRESKPGKPVFNRTVTLRDSWIKEAKKG
jgi:glutaminyl-tRNA synthetase